MNITRNNDKRDRIKLISQRLSQSTISIFSISHIYISEGRLLVPLYRIFLARTSRPEQDLIRLLNKNFANSAYIRMEDEVIASNCEIVTPKVFRGSRFYSV